MLDYNLYLENFVDKIASFQKVFNGYTFRNITVIGKITYIECIALQIIVQTPNDHIDPQDQLIEQIQSDIYAFIQNGKGV